MAIFLCRWPNGSFSVVGAANKTAAVIELDEIGNTDGAEIYRKPSSLLDFEIAREAANQEISFDALFRLAGFGEQTRDFILEKAYPKLDETLSAALEAEATDPAAARRLWTEAVEFEMTRVNHEPKGAETEIGRHIQNQMGMSGELANQIVLEGGQRLLESFEAGSKPKQ